MKVINTGEIDLDSLPDWEKEQVYNGLDVCVTHEVFQAIEPQLTTTTRATYEFSKSLQGPVIEMGIRGVLIDKGRKAEVIEEYYQLMDRLESQLNTIVLYGVGMPSFNWRSYRDRQQLFYEELGLPVGRNGPKTDHDTREKLEIYPVAEQIMKHINAIAKLGKKISVLQTKLDDDGRIRTSYNIAGTDTGRFSSSESEFGTGTNLQNIEESLRSIFIADPGMKFAKADAKSGESFVVGAIEWNLFGDGRYLDVCESGDPHTAVARTVWPNLGWTGDLRQDKAIADQPFYYQHSYRFMCKKIGHGTNYGGREDAIAAETKLPASIIREFQPKYFKAFPAHQKWHEWVQRQLISSGHLTSLTGRQRWFFKRRRDAKTLKEALAYDPQGSLADIVNQAMLKVWTKGLATIVMHDHDALTFMYPEEQEDELIPILLRELVIPIPLNNGRTLRIPYDIQVGWNKAHTTPDNPDGLVDWTGHDSRQRHPILGLLDRAPKCQS